MKARTFNTRATNAHEIYSARVLGMRRNLSPGPDLISDTALVEVKSRLLFPGHPKKWVVEDHQTNYSDNQSGLPFYWALGFYKLDRRVAEIPHNTKSPEIFESYVTFREIYLVPHDWMNQFPAHQCNGRTEQTEWELFLRYSNFSRIPKTAAIFKAEKGSIHLTEGVFPEHFPRLVA